jgi:hypothetical protein
MSLSRRDLLFGAAQKVAKRLSGDNKTAKNFLESIASDKLLTSLVGQYLRNRISYSFLDAVFCDAGFNAPAEPCSVRDSFFPCFTPCRSLRPFVPPSLRRFPSLLSFLRLLTPQRRNVATTSGSKFSSALSQKTFRFFYQFLVDTQNLGYHQRYLGRSK